MLSTKLTHSLSIIFLLVMSSSLQANKLYRAALEGKDQQIIELIDKGDYKNRIDEHEYFSDNTPLFGALNYDQINAAKILLDRGANINALNGYDKETALIRAVKDKKPEIYKFLLANKADPNIKDRDSKTALHYAAINNDFEAAEALINAGASATIRDINRTDPWEEGKYALDYVADTKSPLYQILLIRVFPLHNAITNRDLDQLKRLLSSAQQDVNEKNKQGQSPISLAFNPFDAKIARLLVENGAILPSNSSALFKDAIKDNDFEAVRFLVAHKADIDPELLNLAIKEKRDNIVYYFLEQNVPQIPDRDGNTPLHLAAQNNDPALVRILLGRGANASALNDMGSFAFDMVPDKTGELYRYLNVLVAPFRVANIAIFIDGQQEENAAKKGEMQALSQEISVALKQQQLVIASSSLIAAIYTIAENKKAKDIELAQNALLSLGNYKIFQNKDASITLFLPTKNPLMAWAQLENLGFNEEALMAVPENVLKDRVLGVYDRKFKLDNLTSLFSLSTKPLKNIYLVGHGGQKHSIAHLSFDQYKDVIKFFNKIGTMFLYVSSCFAGGANLLLAHKNLMRGLKDSEKEQVDDVNFPIVIASSTDAPSTTFAKGLRFDRFFGGLNSYFFAKSKMAGSHYIPQSFASILYNITTNFLENIPQVRFPHTRGYFDAVDLDNKLAIINYPKLLELELAKKAKRERPEIEIDNKKRAVLLYPGLLKVPLRLKKKGYSGFFAPIISMIPDNAWHYIEELDIDSPQKNVEDAIRDIFTRGVTKRESRKAFLIKKLIFNGRKFREQARGNEPSR